ncbi:MAG: PhzF family phenazine biosynthesis protein [Ilumatobacter sp.]|uniref:PhzF family phenazine biosynthesis protein n=1 Tax=Ilumatobacter sp. TaxID=1967498 RepID=UPI001D665B94|nr:PhzF family phenazine biosynthesis protein [Ilumatobacter sp.]MBT5277404.1 PhzF family phenazine biosynthesis protein [Ilumatobacter sp.]MBT5552594.1 PhzF family phenazine biosynthesis protein [Ilumatobacter sp.]MBT5865861.1 PhzF family phenazine biosynthesis protein [Ilumatobacter sp.]MDG0975129.1 PhzF family phenazine biosynthesis protein [Ilumatobacter sp.]
MRTYRFDQVDVFAAGPFTGNPLAVLHQAQDLSATTMQTVTRWTNLSEVAFLLAPTVAAADYRVRIFEPKSELPFAGHPTLGACAAWLAAGGIPKRDGVIVQECGAGLIKIRQSASGALAFAAPPMTRHEPVDANDLDRVLDVLGIDAADVVDSSWIDNGPGWMGLLLSSAQHVLGLPAPTATASHFDVGVVGLHPVGHVATIELRAFFNDPNGSIREDPVTGSLNASVAQWLLAMGIVEAPYVAAQTTGSISVEQADGEIWVGGVADVRVSGTIEL